MNKDKFKYYFKDINLNKLDAYDIPDEMIIPIFNIANYFETKIFLIKNKKNIKYMNLISHLIKYCDKFDIFDYEDNNIKLSKIINDKHSFAKIT